MERRDFLKFAAAGSMSAVVGTTAGCAAGETAGGAQALQTTGFPRGTGRMVVGCQSRNGTGQEALEFLARHGVYYMDPGSPRMIEGVGWDLADAQRQVEEAARYGISIQAYHLPLSSAGIDRVAFPNIMLGRSPERDREIEMLQQQIEVTGRAGVPILLYNTIILPILRTGRTADPTRGNVSYSTWNYQEAVSRGMHQEPITGGGADIDEIYERITYLLDRVLPVAEEYNVKLGNHIADPPAPAGYRGVTRWNSPEVFAGIQRFAQLYDSPSHGFNLCLGSTAEGLTNPRTEIIPIIEWIGARRQIFNIHLRNIKGGFNNFQEVYPDNGDMDFVGVVRALSEVGYDGMLMPDHVPQHEDEASRDQGFAFAYGHTKAILQTIYGWDAYPAPLA